MKATTVRMKTVTDSPKVRLLVYPNFFKNCVKNILTHDSLVILFHYIPGSSCKAYHLVEIFVKAKNYYLSCQ